MDYKIRNSYYDGFPNVYSGLQEFQQPDDGFPNVYSGLQELREPEISNDITQTDNILRHVWISPGHGSLKTSNTNTKNNINSIPGVLGFKDDLNMHEYGSQQTSKINANKNNEKLSSNMEFLGSWLRQQYATMTKGLYIHDILKIQNTQPEQVVVKIIKGLESIRYWFGLPLQKPVINERQDFVEDVGEGFTSFLTGFFDNLIRFVRNTFVSV